MKPNYNILEMLADTYIFRHSDEIDDILSSYPSPSAPYETRGQFYRDLRAIAHSMGHTALPDWEDVRDELLKTYGPEGQDAGSLPCTHEFTPLFNSTNGFCKLCDQSGFVNEEGEIEWQ